jgi:hypothetical protein
LSPISLVNRLGTLLAVHVKPGTVETIDETDVEKAVQILLKEKKISGVTIPIGKNR